MKTISQKLKTIADKYSVINHNQDNYSIGGGLANGVFASNRHQDAKYDAGKLTEGQATQLFKKATDLEIDVIKSIINFAIPCMQWHHAGKLPKQYGGGMKKTYFVTSLQIVILAENFSKIHEAFLNSKFEKEIELKKSNDLQNLKYEFLKENAKRFERKESTPDNSFITDSEMNGKYGWFVSKWHYNMTIYYSGWEFKSAKLRDEYFLKF